MIKGLLLLVGLAIGVTLTSNMSAWHAVVWCTSDFKIDTDSLSWTVSYTHSRVKRVTDCSHIRLFENRKDAIRFVNEQAGGIEPEFYKMAFDLVGLFSLKPETIVKTEATKMYQVEKQITVTENRTKTIVEYQ